MKKLGLDKIKSATINDQNKLFKSNLKFKEKQLSKGTEKRSSQGVEKRSRNVMGSSNGFKTSLKIKVEDQEADYSRNQNHLHRFKRYTYYPYYVLISVQ